MNTKPEQEGKVDIWCIRGRWWAGEEHLVIRPASEHQYAYSGKIPCTGPRRCIFCGKREK